MAVKYKVEYGKDVYEQAGLGFADLLTIGTMLQQKGAGLIGAMTAVMSDKAEITGEVFSFYKTIQDVFTPEEWKLLLETILFNEGNLVIVNGVALDTDQLEDHFRGDFLRLYIVGIKLAIKNLGELTPFMESLGEFAKTIADSLGATIKERLDGIESQLKKSNTKPKKQSAI